MQRLTWTIYRTIKKQFANLSSKEKSYRYKRESQILLEFDFISNRNNLIVFSVKAPWGGMVGKNPFSHPSYCGFEQHLNLI